MCSPLRDALRRRLIYLVSLVVVLSMALTSTTKAELVGWWRFDEGSGTIANDSSGNGRHMPTYKTPDVYVEEISVFPPSVAEVETAVPAFIGYTEKANYYGKNLLNQAVKITSWVDYGQHFGTRPKLEITSVELSKDNEVKEVVLEDKSKFQLWDSVRMFYKNGGGNCYIISIGSYKDDIDPDSFAEGLRILEAEDEPTMILFPDGVLLDDNDLYSLQQAALKQAAKLKDRVVIMDIRESATIGSPLGKLRENIQKFRDTVGINNLKYGAAYAPYIVSNFDKELRYKDIKDSMKQEGFPIKAKELAGDNPSSSLNDSLENYDSLAADEKQFNKKLGEAIKSVVNDTTSKNLKQEYKTLLIEYKKDKTVANVKNLAKFMGKIIDLLADDLVQGNDILKYPELLKELKTKITSDYAGYRGSLRMFNEDNVSDLLQTDGDLGVTFTNDELAKARSNKLDISVNACDGQTTKLALYTNVSYKQPGHGKIKKKDDWKLTYTPDVGYKGPDSFILRITGAPADKNVFLSFVEETIAGNKDSIQVVKNSKSEEISLTGAYTQDTLPAHGTLTETAGKLVYEPKSKYVGADKFKYKDDTTAKTVYVSVFDTTSEALNKGIKINVKMEGPEDIELAKATKAEKDSTSAKGVNITKTNSVLEYAPGAGKEGEDSFTYRIVYFFGVPLHEYKQEFTVKVNVVKAEELFEKPIDVLSALFTEINTTVNDFKEAIGSYDEQFEKSLLTQLPVIESILKETTHKVNVQPPCGAMAGVYSYVDRTRGVWKAPANISLNSVIDLRAKIDNNFQEGMNVDVTAGKSVNAIRAFAGKGILVWGARTLAGNDNEWRYISVRRFFNMVEESVKKSTYWAVFEPNDANLWIKVKAMIENYLIEKWRDGALAGAKPEHAFFVKVGLGITMTALDILEGRLIIEIGMAVVRPAEFIILRFMHKMQES